MKWDCDYRIDQMVVDAKRHLEDHIEMLYIQAVSKLTPEIKIDTPKKIDSSLIEDYLKKRGYTMNYVLGKTVMVKGFTCVYVQDDYVEVWHDKTNNNKSVFVNESLLTGLPITLSYMERI
ncbi:hypothetical protein [Seonamhaeicola sp.]|uniref:hypothetical protein n=1 Tax=Seonamhaeicola sp. TaxID=1912245 RepID=UPI00356707C7